MNNKRLQRLEEKAKSLGKQLFIEETIIDNKTDNLEVIVYDKVQLKEDSNGNTIQCRGVIKNAPVSRYTRNLNSRKYIKPLWEGVQQKGVFEGSDCYADHSDDEPSVIKICGVWGPLKLGEDLAYADLYCIGEYGSLMLEKLKVNGKCGFSTVGMGTLMENDEETVDPETYIYENTDWIFSPSQQTFATKENLYNPQNNSKKIENVQINEQKNNNFKEDFTNNKQEFKENLNINIEQKEVLNMSDKVYEAAFKNQITKILKEAVKNPNILEAIDELTNLSIPVELSESVSLKKEIDSTISNLQVKLEEQKKNIEKSLVEKENAYNKLKEDFDNQTKVLEGIKEKFSMVQEVLKKNDIEDLKDVSALKESLTNMSFDLKCFKEEKEKLAGTIKIFEEDTKYRDFDLKRYAEDIEKSNEQIKKLMSERNDMLSDLKIYENKLKHAEKYIVNLRNRLKEEGVEDEEIEELGSVKENELAPVMDNGSEKKEDNELITVEGATADQVDVKEDQELQTVEGSEKDQVQILEDDNTEEVVIGGSEKKEEPVMEDEEETIDAPVMEDDEMNEPIMSEEDTEPTDWAGFGDENGSEKKEEEDEMVSEIASSKKKEKVVKYKFETIDAKKALKESVKKPVVTKPVVKNNSDIIKYYESQIVKNPSLKNFEKQIKGSKSLLEAVNKVEKLKENSDSVVKMEHVSDTTSWVPKNRW